MNTILPGYGYGLQSATSPITAGGKVAGNRGATTDKLTGTDSAFGALFSDAIQNVQELDTVKNADSYNLAVGDLDDLGAMMTNSERAQVAFQLLVQIRNKALDAYSEIMRMNI